ncbi:hypothetical protein trd_0992 [Thermomicrobium roseum DSM 5159]|uniref:Uncharacterized protein n=1 Tax=Thermomicrobium roseum (strain ATCC 27502 / DSM 5159 / P-2) TaxID=309801 RepID=B9KZZ5_THERP|nr:hypothetical protein trd_0992 [Thermomicrobium roseum DSM 5159]
MCSGTGGVESGEFLLFRLFRRRSIARSTGGGVSIHRYDAPAA